MDFFAFKIFKFNWFFLMQWVVKFATAQTSLPLYLFIYFFTRMSTSSANWSQVTRIHVIVQCTPIPLSGIWSFCESLIVLEYYRTCYTGSAQKRQWSRQTCANSLCSYGFDNSIITTLTSIFYGLWWTHFNNYHFPVD